MIFIIKFSKVRKLDKRKDMLMKECKYPYIYILYTFLFKECLLIVEHLGITDECIYNTYVYVSSKIIMDMRRL